MSRTLPPPNLLDRLIAPILPGVARQRVRNRAAFELYAAAAGKGGYGGYGNSRSRRRQQYWSRSSGSADADIVPAVQELRESARDLVRNTAIATAAAKRSKTFVIGTGLRPQSRIDRDYLGLDAQAADDWQTEAERIFRTWASTAECDARRTQNFWALQALAFAAVWESGDCFCAFREVERGAALPLALQFYEADQISNPLGMADGTVARKGQNGLPDDADGHRFVDGVELDGLGAPVRYWIQSHHPGQLGGRTELSWSGLPAFGAKTGRRQVLHLFDTIRIGQSRGVPELAPLVEAIKNLGTYTEAEIHAAVIGSMITVLFKTEEVEVEQSDPSEGIVDDVNSKRDLPFQPGMVYRVKPDEEVISPTPGRPNSAYSEFETAIVRLIAATLEIPYEVLTLRFIASYSASRAALETMYKWVQARREWFIGVFCQPVWAEVISRAVAAGMLKAPAFFSDPMVRAAWLGVEWVGPARISLDPKKEFDARAIAEDRGWTTAANNTAELTGGDWERNIAQRVREEEARQALPGASAAQGGNGVSPGSGSGAGDPDDEPDPDLPEEEDRT